MFFGHGNCCGSISILGATWSTPGGLICNSFMHYAAILLHLAKRPAARSWFTGNSDLLVVPYFLELYQMV